MVRRSDDGVMNEEGSTRPTSRPRWRSILSAISDFLSIYSNGGDTNANRDKTRVRSAFGRLCRRVMSTGVFDATERALLWRVVEPKDVQLTDVMTPRIRMSAIRSERTVEEAREALARSKEGILIVIGESADDVVGWVGASDLLYARPDQRVEEVARPPYCVPETKPIADLVGELAKRNLDVAVIVDEYGGTRGCVTLRALSAALVSWEKRSEVPTSSLSPLPELQLAKS